MPTIIDISEVLLEMGLTDESDFERAVVNSAITRAEGAVKRHLKYDPVQRSRTEYYPTRTFAAMAREGIWDVQNDTAVLRRLVEAASSELQMRHIPIRSVTSVVIDYDGRSGTSSGAFTNDPETEGTDFWANYDMLDDDGNSVCTDGILRSFGNWPVEPGSIRVIYTAGYSDAELHGQGTLLDASPIIDAVIQEAKRRAMKVFVEMKSTSLGGTGFTPGPIVSERLGDYSYQLGGSGSGGSTADRKYGGTYDILPETREMISDFVNWGWPLGS